MIEWPLSSLVGILGLLAHLALATKLYEVGALNDLGNLQQL